jgi:hypothetical protein
LPLQRTQAACCWKYQTDNKALAPKSTHFQASSIDGIVTAVAAAVVAEAEAIAALPLPAESCRQAQAQVGFGEMGGSSVFKWTK